MTPTHAKPTVGTMPDTPDSPALDNSTVTDRPLKREAAYPTPAGKVLQARHVQSGRSHRAEAQTKKLSTYARAKRSGGA